MIKYRKNKFLILNSYYEFFENKNIFVFKNILGIIKFYISSYFFFKKNTFLFLKEEFFLKFLNNFFYFYNKFFRFYFFKLRLRGLGYRIKKITNKLYRFFFAFNHYFYFHISKDIFFKHRRRNLIIFSHNLIKLNDIFSNLLLLKKLDFYERNNTFIISRKILFFKKRK